MLHDNMQGGEDLDPRIDWGEPNAPVGANPHWGENVAPAHLNDDEDPTDTRLDRAFRAMQDAAARLPKQANDDNAEDNELRRDMHDLRIAFNNLANAEGQVVRAAEALRRRGNVLIGRRGRGLGRHGRRWLARRWTIDGARDDHWKDYREPLGRCGCCSTSGTPPRGRRSRVRGAG